MKSGNRRFFQQVPGRSPFNIRCRVVSVLGTRPEVIKLAPVIWELKRRNELFESIILTTAQHREILDQALNAFRITPNFDLNLMEHDQSLYDFASRALSAISRILLKIGPDLVLVQGDTTTVMTAGLAAFYHGIPVGHIEAGLRTFQPREPFPEEMNRHLISCLTEIHFAPTPAARLNLLREGIQNENIFITGNTVVDALIQVSSTNGFSNQRLAQILVQQKKILLVTAHRRETHGLPLHAICKALKILARRHEDVVIVYPVHPNPNVSSTVYQELSDVPRIHLIPPVSYSDFLHLMSCCYCILTDSGGIQEEAPSFGKPVLILRQMTERPEIVESGGAKIVGTNTALIIDETQKLLSDSETYEKMSRAGNPFGDGKAAKRIVNILQSRFVRKAKIHQRGIPAFLQAQQ